MYSLTFLEIAYFEITSFNVALQFFSWAKFRACFCGKGGSFILFIVLLHFLFPVYVTYLSFAKSYSCIVQHAKTQKKRRKMQSHSSHYRKCQPYVEQYTAFVYVSVYVCVCRQKSRGFLTFRKRKIKLIKFCCYF